MKKIFLSVVFLAASTCFVIAQDDYQIQKKPRMMKPDMQKDTVTLYQGHYAGPIKSEYFSKSDSLTLNKTGLLIVGFSLVFRMDSTLKKFDSRNNKLTPEMITALKMLKPGQRFSFVNVRAMANGGALIKPTYDHIDMFVDRKVE